MPLCFIVEVHVVLSNVVPDTIWFAVETAPCEADRILYQLHSE